jgi:hypothetical protein
MTTKLTQVPRIEEFVLSEANGFLSRDEVTVTLQGTAIKSGTVMSKLTATGKWVPYDDVGTDGSEVASGILYVAQPAGSGDVKAVMFTRDCEVVRAALTGLNANGEADLLAKGIKVVGKYTTK